MGWYRKVAGAGVGLYLLVLLMGIGLLLPSLTFSDVVTPSERVSIGVNVREHPRANSQILQVLRPSEELEYVGSVPGWHEVIIANGQHGFVSKAWTRIVTTAVAGVFTIDIVDVGTGLAVFVRGESFALVYDGGSNDDLARGDGNRFLSFLRSQHPDLTLIHHVILSHPHRDHLELLPDLITRYQVRDFWDSGAVNDICGYRAFIHEISKRPQAIYHSARFNFGNHPVSFAAKTCYGDDLPAATIALPHGARIDHQPIALGAGASMTFLHADGSTHNGFNENSLVVRLDLGPVRILIMGDAEAGSRADPDTPPVGHSIEGILIDCCSAQLRADILIVGHHGSKTSSRAAFLNAVGATRFVVSSGPMKYGKVILPDPEIITELESRGTVFRTDLNDSTCNNNPAKIGPDNDSKAGGCDNVRIVLNGGSQLSIAYFRPSD